MTNVVTYLVEAGVGLACLIAAVATWRRPGHRVVSILLAVAGATAVIHAVVSLL